MARFALTLSVQWSIVITLILFGILAVIAVGLRIYARHLRQKPMDASDYCILAALCVTISYMALNVSLVFDNGVGFHLLDIVKTHGMAPITEMLKKLIAVQIMWAVSLTLVKVSILLFYARIFEVQGFIVSARIAAVFIGMWASAVILSSFLLCRPFAFNWDQTIPGGKCSNQVLSYQITGVLNLVTDVVVLLLPMPYIWNLQLRLSRKIALTATFSVGIFVCVLSILRINSLSTIDYKDITYNIPQALIWGTLEPELGVILACTPILRPIFMRDRSQAGSSNQSSYGKRYRSQSTGTMPNSGSSGSRSLATQKDFALLEDGRRDDRRGFGKFNATKRADLERYPMNEMDHSAHTNLPIMNDTKAPSTASADTHEVVDLHPAATEAKTPLTSSYV